MYRYYLDNNLLQDEPQGWDKFVTTIKRDRELKGILKTVDSEIAFRGDGYNYLKNISDTQNFCSAINLVVQISGDYGNTYRDFHIGIIFISDVIFDEKRGLASTKIQDNSFYAKINNNKSQECLPFAGITKNGFPMTVAPLKQIRYYHNTTGVPFAILSGTDQDASCAAYRVYDIFNYLITYMTDGDILFDSTVFGTGEWKDLMMTYGLVISQVQTGLSTSAFKDNFPRLSFDKFFKEIDRLINIGFYIDYTTTKPTFRIEKQTDLYGDNTIFSATDIDELKTSTAIEYLYAKLKIGSNNFNDDPALSYPGDIDWIGFKVEDYNMMGVCNLDRTLDISRDFVVDTNAIQGQLGTGDSNDDDIFIIDTLFDTGIIYNAVGTNNLSHIPLPLYYNEVFTNDAIAKRYIGGIPNSVAFWLGNQDNRFQASKTISESQSPVTAAFEPVKFQDDMVLPNFDASGNYDPATSTFTVPQSGIYTFFTLLKGLFKNNSSFPTWITEFHCKLYVYDSFGYGVNPALYSYVMFDNNLSSPSGANTPFNFSASVSINLTALQTVIISLDVIPAPGLGSAPVNVTIQPGSVFACTKDVTGGGQYHAFDPADSTVLLHKLSYPFQYIDFEAIISDVRGQIGFNRNMKPVRSGWIEQIKFDHRSNQMDMMLTSNKKLNS